jgi:vacuolar protein-sorting-associated protein 4
VIDNTGKVQKPDDALKLEGALAGAIITEKPNVKWDDVVGLELAK